MACQGLEAAPVAEAADVAKKWPKLFLSKIKCWARVDTEGAPTRFQRCRRPYFMPYHPLPPKMYPFFGGPPTPDAEGARMAEKWPKQLLF